MVDYYSTMIKREFQIFLVSLFLLLLSGCGGGSSGTAVGGSGDLRLFSGIVVSADGKTVSAAQVNLLNTDDTTTTDEAGAFELSTSFVETNTTFEVKSPTGQNATVDVTSPDPNQKNVDLSILFNAAAGNAELLPLTLRARIVGNCGPFFINTRTIRQTSAITDGFTCRVEADFRRNGLPANGLLFQLQNRGCGVNEPWQFTAADTSGTSGPGIGEVPFEFRNDEKHCVYRIVGPLNAGSDIPISAQINSLRKERFDKIK